MSSKVASVYLQWLQGGPLLPDWFPAYDMEDASVRAQCEGAFNCMSPDRVAIASFIGHILLLVLFSAASDRFKAYRRLPAADKCWWISNLLGIEHAIVATLGAYKHTLLTDLYQDTVWKANYQYHFYLSFSLGYFVVDLLFLAVVSFFTGRRDIISLKIIVHHAVSSFAVWYALFVPLSYLAGWLLLTEASTPFVDLRIILKYAGLYESWVFYINNVLVFITFLLARVASLGLYWYNIALYSHELLDLAFPMPFLIYSVSACFTVLNMIWFHNMVYGENSVVRRLRTSRSRLTPMEKKEQ